MDIRCKKRRVVRKKFRYKNDGKKILFTRLMEDKNPRKMREKANKSITGKEDKMTTLTEK